MKKISFVFLFLFSITNANAGLLRVESNTFFAAKRGDDLKTETPLYEEFLSTYQDSKKNLNLNFNFGYSYNFNKKNYNFDLNQLNGEVEVIKDTAVLSVGRSFESYHLIKSSIVDSVAFDARFLEGKMRTGVMLGVIRNFEFDEATSAAPVVAVYADYNNRDIYPLYTEIRFENVNYHSVGRDQYQMVKVGAKKELPTSVNSELYVNVERNLTYTNSYRYEGGLDFYPGQDWNYGVSYQQYQRNIKEGFEKSIFNTFSLGKIHEYSAKVGKFFEHRIYSGLTLQLDQYPVQRDQKTTGHKEQWNISYGASKFKISNDLFYMHSFGGRAIGDRATASYAINDYLDMLLENEYIKYKKITSENNNAVASRFGVGTAYFRPFKSQLLAEVSSNNFYSEEWALLVKLSLVDWSAI